MKLCKKYTIKIDGCVFSVYNLKSKGGQYEMKGTNKKSCWKGDLFLNGTDPIMMYILEERSEKKFQDIRKSMRC